MLTKIISGGQNGVDKAALRAAKAFGLQTGGTMPKGFKTLSGPKPNFATLYNMTEDKSSSYPPRTESNVKNSDGTLMIAVDFNSAGEKCTQRFIDKHNKPQFDINPLEFYYIKSIVGWIDYWNIKVLNVAGNSEKTAPGIGKETEEFLGRLFLQLGYKSNGISRTYR